MLTLYRWLTVSGSPWRSKAIARGGQRRGGGNKVHGVYGLEGSNLGLMEQVIEGEYTSDAAGTNAAIGGMIATAVRCITVVCQGSVVWQDDSRGW